MSALVKRYEGAAETLAALATSSNIQALETIPNHIHRALVQADAVQEFARLLTDDLVKAVIMPLQNNALGFRTDKPDGGYPLHVVREAVVEALMRGFHISGNEFNIIAGRFYAAQAGFVRLCRERVSDLREEPTIKAQTPTGALVLYRMEWTINGKKDSFERAFPVRVQDKAGPDLIVGKAKRKAYAYLWQIISGRATDEGDGDLLEAEYSETPAPPTGRSSVRKPPAEAPKSEPPTAPKTEGTVTVTKWEGSKWDRPKMIDAIDSYVDAIAKENDAPVFKTMRTVLDSHGIKGSLSDVGNDELAELCTMLMTSGDPRFVM